MQRGQSSQKGRTWSLKYRAPILQKGEIVQLQVCKRFAQLDEKYESKRSVAPLASKFLAPAYTGILRRPTTRAR